MRLTILALIFCVINLELSAQCNPTTTSKVGLSPHWASSEVDCIVLGQTYSDTIYFKNFTNFVGFQVHSLRLDSIGRIFEDGIWFPNSGMPNGLFYTTNLGKAPVTWMAGETGCISINGTVDTGTTLGNWKLGIYVTIWVDTIGEITGEAGALSQQFGNGNFSYYLKLRANSSVCIDSVWGLPPIVIIDTIVDDDTVTTNGNVVIREISTLSNFTITPNPFTTSTTINFNSAVAGNYKFFLTDVVGKELELVDMKIKNGVNQIELNRNNLPGGMYLFTITNGKQRISKRLVIQY